MKQILLSGMVLAAFASGNLHAQCLPVATLDQNFNNFTAFPDSCWSASGTSTNFYLYDDNGNNVVMFYTFFAPNTPFYLVTPELSTIDGNHYITFDAACNSALAYGAKIQIGTLDSITNYASFVAHGTEITLNDTAWSNHSSIMIPADTSYKHIVLRFTAISNHQAIKVDNFKWEHVPPPVVCNAVSAINEGFDNFTAFPDSCWTTSAAYPYFSLNDTTSDNEVIFYSMFSVDTPFYLTTPELSTIDGNHILKFKSRPSGVPGDIKVQIGTLEANDDYTSFVAHGSEIVINGGTEQEYTSVKIPANSNYKYVSLQIKASAAHQVLLLDDFLWEEAPPTTGITDNSKNNFARLYPNPVSDNLLIEARSKINTVTVFDLTGKVVAQLNVADTKAGIYVGNLANGMYLLQLNTEKDGIITAKFAKE